MLLAMLKNGAGPLRALSAALATSAGREALPTMTMFCGLKTLVGADTSARYRTKTGCSDDEHLIPPISSNPAMFQEELDSSNIKPSECC